MQNYQHCGRLSVQIMLVYTRVDTTITRDVLLRYHYIRVCVASMSRLRYPLTLGTVIMLLRVWLFWGRTKKITIFLCASSVIVFIPGATYVLSHHDCRSLRAKCFPSAADSNVLVFSLDVNSLPTDLLGCHSTGALVSVDYALTMFYDTRTRPFFH